jgi:hypothetical protein
MDFPVADWEAIPLDTYKVLFSEIKERFDVTTDETVSCTDKSIKCLLAFITFIFGVGIFLIKSQYNIDGICYSILIGFSAYNVYLGYRIIRLRPSHTTGLLPDNVLSKDYNLKSGFTNDEKEKLFYYKAIDTYLQKITEGTKDNSIRAKKYDTFFQMTLLLVLLITVFVFYTISFHPVSVKS